MDDCIFCKILAGDIPSRKIYENEDAYALYEISPQAEVHALVISKKHTPDLAHNADLSDRELAACLRACAKAAELLGIAESGYRIVSNCGDDACQTIKHLHFHVLGGQKLNPRVV